MDADARHTRPKTLVVNNAVSRAVCCTRGESENVHGLAVESDAAVPLDVMTRQGVRGKPDVSALASRGADELTVLVWHC
jgi:hypothetical protein